MRFEFASPWLLLLLLLLPFIGWLRCSRRFQSSLQYSDTSGMTQLPKSWAQRLHPVLHVLFLSGLGLLIVSLARPREGLEESRVDAEVIDIVLLIDTSGSMEALDMSEGGKRRNRLDAAKNVVTEFIQAREHDRLAMIAFAGEPYTITPLTTDKEYLLAHMDRLQIGMIKDGTAIGTAIASGINRLRHSDAKSKIILLLTDGSDNASSVTPTHAAELAAATGIRIYTVACGADGPVEIPATDVFGRKMIRTVNLPIDHETLQEIADISNGLYFRARNFGELARVYQEIDTLERTEISIDAYTLYEEHFAILCIAGVLCLLSERCLRHSRIGRTLQ